MTDSETSGAPEPFGIELEPRRETIVVSPRGELDIETADQLEQQVRDLLTVGFRRIVVDLRRVSFIDSTGLRALLGAGAASRDAGVELALVQGPAPVRRLFTLTRTEDALHFVDPDEIDPAGT